jgi:hypothetical protein
LCSDDNAKLSGDVPFYTIPTAGAMLQQPDLIEHSDVTDVIVLGSVFNEVRSKNTSVGLRLKEMLRSSQKRFFFFSNEHCKVCFLRVWPCSVALLTY